MALQDRGRLGARNISRQTRDEATAVQLDYKMELAIHSGCQPFPSRISQQVTLDPVKFFVSVFGLLLSRFGQLSLMSRAKSNDAHHTGLPKSWSE